MGQGCSSYSLEDKENCPWDNYKLGLPYCGFTANGMDPKEALLDNGDAVWRLTPLKLNANKYILQSASKKRVTIEATRSGSAWPSRSRARPPTRPGTTGVTATTSAALATGRAWASSTPS